MHNGSIQINNRAGIGENFMLYINSVIVAGGTPHDAPCLRKRAIVRFCARILGNTNITMVSKALANISVMMKMLRLPEYQPKG